MHCAIDRVCVDRCVCVCVCVGARLCMVPRSRGALGAQSRIGVFLPSRGCARVGEESVASGAVYGVVFYVQGYQ